MITKEIGQDVGILGGRRVSGIRKLTDAQDHAETSGELGTWVQEKRDDVPLKARDS